MKDTIEKCRVCGGVSLQQKGQLIVCPDCGAVFDTKEKDSRSHTSVDDAGKKKWIFRLVILLLAVITLVLLELTTHFLSRAINFLWQGR